jgi:HEAT repeat protein
MAGNAGKFLVGAVAIGAALVLGARWYAEPPETTASTQAAPTAQAPSEPMDENQAAALALAKTMLSADSVFDRFLAAGTLLEVGDKSGYALLNEGLASPDPTVARAAMDTLLSIPDICILADTIASMADRPILNQALLRGIAYFSRQEALPYVREAMNSSVSTVRVMAIRTVARLNDATSLDHLLGTLETRGMMDDELANVYYAIAALGSGATVEAGIIRLTENADATVREVSSIALGHLDSEASKAALARLVDDQDTRVRAAALGSHITHGAEHSITALEQLITTGHRDYASLAAAALKRVPPGVAHGIIKRVVECCDLKPEVAMRLMESWGQIDGGGALDLTVPGWGLRHADPDVRLQTAWALGWKADPAGLDLLLPYLKDQDPAMQGMSAWAIARIGRPEPKAAPVGERAPTPECPTHDQSGDDSKEFKAAAWSRSGIVDIAS